LPKVANVSWILEAERKERQMKWRKVLIFGVLAPLATLVIASCGLLIAWIGPPRLFPITQTIKSKAPVCGTWNATAWPNVSHGGLKSLAVISKDDIFIPLPENHSTASLSSVAAITANDVWIVGEHASGGHRSAFAAHWNGKSWRLVTTPNPMNENGFADVATIPEGGVWAVGNSHHHEDDPNYALAAHFDSCPPAAAP
jgi:hypothetical protein